jgi:hypothetical protein
MIADFMSGVDDGTDDRRVPLGLLADDKKRRSRVKLSENVKDTRRKHRVRAIVKRQRHGVPIRRTTSHRALTLGSQQIGTDGIERGSRGHPGEQHVTEHAYGLHRGTPPCPTAHALASATESPPRHAPPHPVV